MESRSRQQLWRVDGRARDHPSRFGALLKRVRLAHGLIQEALAERAGLSAHAISDLERDVHSTPRKKTIRLLADLDAATRRQFTVVALPEELP